MIATKMNGADLPADHGFPARVVLPGVAGARNVKWLTSVKIEDEECESPWQAQYYKDDESLASPGTKVSIQALPLQSMVLTPEDGASVKVAKGGKATVPVKGIAYSGYTGSKITKVEVSTDAGRTWQTATLKDDEVKAHADDFASQSFGWMRWETEVQLEGGKTDAQVMCRATAADGTTQPLRSAKHCGYLYNGCHTVSLKVE